MKKMQIFEPAMCCSTGLCGVSVNPELLRISTVLNTLAKNNIVVDRFNLNSAPMEFVNNKVMNEFINKGGVDELPAVMLDGKIIMTGRYPTNEEFIALLDLPVTMLPEAKKAIKVPVKKVGGCNCKGGCC
jgi:hypothetical protein